MLFPEIKMQLKIVMGTKYHRTTDMGGSSDLGRLDIHDESEILAEP